jgi:hypothetical protein
MKITQQLLYNRIDDWIIFGIKRYSRYAIIVRENDFIYECNGYFKDCINQRIQGNFSKVHPKVLIVIIIKKGHLGLVPSSVANI